MRLQRCLGRKGAHDECGSGQGAVLPKGRDGGSQSRYWCFGVVAKSEDSPP